MQYTLIALVEDKPGVLNRVASLFRRRNFNIESLAVGRTEKPGVSRMTIVTNCESDMDAHKIEANLYKLVNVIDVQDVSREPSVNRDLALIKVKATPEQRSEINNLAAIFRARSWTLRLIPLSWKHRNRRQGRGHDRTVMADRYPGNGPYGTDRHDFAVNIPVSAVHRVHMAMATAGTPKKFQGWQNTRLDDGP